MSDIFDMYDKMLKEEENNIKKDDVKKEKTPTEDNFDDEGVNTLNDEKKGDENDTEVV